MTYPEFAEQLRQTGEYHTQPDYRPPFMYRVLGRFDAWYYWLGLIVILHARKLAGRGQFTFDQWASHSFWTLRNVELCGGHAHITGCDNLSRLQGPAVFVANHMSMLETFLLGALLVPYRDASVVVKQSLVEHRIFGKVMRATLPIQVGRINPREDFKQVMTQGQEAIRSGRHVLIFPQATRNTVFHPAEFNSMGVKLAAKAGVPIVPIALKTDFQGIGGLLRDFGPVDRTKDVFITVGPPLDVKVNPRQVHQQCADFIASHYQSWGGIVHRTPPGTEETDNG
jgi:1-acyl-sn-glycerol-3-phosphate acyltransferase